VIDHVYNVEDFACYHVIVISGCFVHWDWYI